MSLYLHFHWIYFCVAFGATLLISLLMSLQSANFYTLYVVIRKFSIIDLEFPVSALELATYIKGIFALPAEFSAKTLRALKGQLYLDFLFMPAAYGSIFILCMKVSMKLTSFGHWVFAVLAWLQLIAWVCDIIENIYLLNKIHPEPVVSNTAVHKAYEMLEKCKWGIALTATICSIAAIFYFWLVGLYSFQSLNYFLIVVAEIIIFLGLKKITAKNEREKLEKFQQT